MYYYSKYHVNGIKSLDINYDFFKRKNRMTVWVLSNEKDRYLSNVKDVFISNENDRFLSNGNDRFLSTGKDTFI